MAYYPQGLQATRNTVGMPQIRGSSVVVTQIDGCPIQRTVPAATVAAVSATVTAVAPAGGTGAAAGGWDTAAHRDTSILSINEVKLLATEEKVTMTALTADVLALKKALTSMVDALQAVGMGA